MIDVRNDVKKFKFQHREKKVLNYPWFAEMNIANIYVSD